MKIHNLHFKTYGKDRDTAKIDYIITGMPDSIIKHIDDLEAASVTGLGKIESYIMFETLHNSSCANEAYTGKYSGMLYNGTYIKKVIYNNPATIIIWSDGTKTSSKCQEGDIYNPELGFLLAYMKKIENSDKILQLLKEWAPIEGKVDVTLSDLRKKERGPHKV